MNLYKKQSLGEEIANSISHGMGTLFAIAMLVLLLVKSDSLGEVFSSIIFALGAMMLYTMSSLYHAFKEGSKVKRVFQRLDHVSIYVLIGSSFAPVFILVIDKPLGWILLIGQWIIIALGITLKAVMVHKGQVIHLFLFLLLGWSALAFIGSLYRFSHYAFYFYLIGGIFYTVGVLFYTFRLFKYSHFVWHLFVLLGTLSHFFAMLFFLY